MTLLPIDERALPILQEERKRLQSTYDECSKIIPGSPALDKITEAIDAIDAEISKRSGL
ncbi:TPA: hypothetical protein RCG84_002865 [Enterobacter roggenkampii]|uniref:hypothetical protein n=1 Tax=Enterobacter sp. CPE_E1241 TaxID=3376801 RepID=UPI0027F9BABD|nr:hypothetical protein [Enterobacter roggenkampii]